MTDGFLASEFTPVPPERARFHVIPVPLERTASYAGGTAKGPAAILAASQQLETFDGVSEPGGEGIYTAAALDCSGPLERIVDDVQQAVRVTRAQGAVPVLLGGEHTVSVGAFQSLVQESESVGIIQFDAHADLRDSYEGTPLSHACVMHRALDMGLPILQLGVRCLSKAETELRDVRGIDHIDAESLATCDMSQFELPAGLPDRVYITFDVDVLDPSLMPATGTPEPGGLFWYDTMMLLRKIAARHEIVGFDVVELAPRAGVHAPDYTCARLVYNLMGFITRQRRRNE